MALFIVKAWWHLESFWHKKKQFGELLDTKKEEEFDETLTTAGIICGGRGRCTNNLKFRKEKFEEAMNSNSSAAGACVVHAVRHKTTTKAEETKNEDNTAQQPKIEPKIE